MGTTNYLRLGIVTVVLALMLAACGTGERQEEASSSVSSTPTVTSAKLPSTATVAPTLADNSAVNEIHLDAAFVADVITVEGGARFTKKWRIRNTGTREWNGASGDFRWVFIGGNQMNGPNRVPLAGIIPVGSEVDVEIELTAPLEPGLYEGLWQLRGPADQPIGSELIVRIEVLTVSAEPPAAEPIVESVPTDADASEFVVQIPEVKATPVPATPIPAPEIAPAELTEDCLDTALVADVNVPDGTVVNPEETFVKTWRIRNTGTCEWTSALGDLSWRFVGGAQMNGPSVAPVVGPIPAGTEVDVEMDLTAPAQPGQYEGRWQLHGPNGDPEGVVFWVLIEVRGADAPTALSDSPSANLAGLSQEIWRHINGERDRHRLYQLAWNEKLALAAQRHAEDCSQRGFCSHDGSDGSDERVRVQRVGYEGSVDESWAWAASPMNAVNWWLDEVPPDDWHRRMLLSERLREVGVGVAPAESGYYFIAVFGVPGR